MKEIVVSGATGMVGRRLVAELAAEGAQVRALTRNPATAHVPAAAQLVAWDGHEVGLDALAGADAVVHLAGEPIFGGLPSAARRRRIRDSRVATTRRLADQLGALGEAQRPRTLVCASAVGYYGDRGEQRLDESQGPGSGFLAQVCVDWEDAAERARAHGLRVVQLRIAVVLSAAGGALPLMEKPFRLGVGGRLGPGAQWFPWIHEADLSALIRAALSDERYAGPTNAAAPGCVTNRELTRALGEVLSRPTLLPVPGFALRALLGDLALELLGSRRVVPAVAERNGFVFRYPELEEALRDLLDA